MFRNQAMKLTFQSLRPHSATVKKDGVIVPVIVALDRWNKYHFIVQEGSKAYPFRNTYSYENKGSAKAGLENLLCWPIYISTDDKRPLAYSGKIACLFNMCSTWADAVAWGYVKCIYKPERQAVAA